MKKEYLRFFCCDFFCCFWPEGDRGCLDCEYLRFSYNLFGDVTGCYCKFSDE